MRAVDFIRRVRDGDEVETADVANFVAGAVSGEVADYQVTAFLMAVFLRGLAPKATTALTCAMRDSGRRVDLSEVAGIKVDKHSTGGVGDKISIPLAPLVAACGVAVPMISGRGLGHTGGTLDKLESIPGFVVDLGLPRFVELVKTLGLSLIGQTSDLAPADKKFYALRDVTATVESIPLITSSILSKKLAEGIDALVLDVKVGRGAFMKNEADARALAHALVEVGTGAGLKVEALLTRMDAPLGRTIGNALEIVESIEILRGEGPADTTALCLELGARMLILGGVCKNADEAFAKLRGAIQSGAALEKFAAVIEAQHGDPRCLEDLGQLPSAPHRFDVFAPQSGYVQQVDSFALGMCAMQLGAGRARAEDKIDPAVGLEVLKKPGDPVQAGEVLVRVHHRHGAEQAKAQCLAAYTLGDVSPVLPASIVLDTIVRE